MSVATAFCRFTGPSALFLALSLAALGAQAQRNLDVGAPAEKRVALVIGNAAYQRGPLRNPVNDARAVAERLQRLGFVVIKRENLRTKDVGSALREFRSRLAPGAAALFFYAGHGIQLKGTNYLPTVDAEIEAEEDVPLQSLNVSQVLEVMEESKTRVNLVFLDACRDNPFARRFRSASRGLAKIDAASGTLISFATRPGSVAADGDGLNGLYTAHLLKRMEEPGVSIEQLLKRVGSDVKLASKGRQEPWSEGLIEGEFYFRPGSQVASAAPAWTPASPLPVDSLAVELAFWDAVKDSRSGDELKAYLARYPQGQFAGLAESRLQSLTASATPSAPPRRPEPAKVYVYKVPGSIGFWHTDYSISAGGRTIGTIPAVGGTAMDFVIEHRARPGELELTAQGGGRSVTQILEVEPGKTYYVEFIKDTVKLRLVDEAAGAAYIAKVEREDRCYRKREC